MTAEPWTYNDGALELRGELYPPTAAPNGRAVLVVHEADGIGGNVRRHCTLLAALGYVVGAADMHGGGRVLDGGEIPGALAAFRAEPALIRGRVGAGFAALGERTGLPPSAMAAIGYCFGGWSVLELARSGAAAAGVVSFHGILTTGSPAGRGDLRASVLAATGARDPYAPAEDVAAFVAEMEEAGADWHLLTHGRALHSFTNTGVDALGDERMRYDPLADAVSWSAATAFLANVLGLPPEG